MLKQVLQQNASKPQAKSNQSQRQIVARHLLVFETQMETTTTSSSYVSASAWLSDGVVLR